MYSWVETINQELELNFSSMSLTVWIMSGWLYCRNRNLGSNCTWTKIGLDLQNIKVSVMVFQQAQYSSTASIPVSIA